jgi:hypothetical protein
MTSGILLDGLTVSSVSTGEPPVCTRDLSLAQAQFLETSPGAFVVTEGQTIVVPFLGEDPDGGTLLAAVEDLPAGASLSPLSGSAPLVSTFAWTPSASDDTGAPRTVRVSFLDPTGQSTACDVTISDVNRLPMCDAGDDQLVGCGGPTGGAAVLSAMASDPDDASLSYLWTVSDPAASLDDPHAAVTGGTFPIGTTVAHLRVSDGRGGVCTSQTSITIESAAPPVLSAIPRVVALTPANHKMRCVKIDVYADGGCGGALSMGAIRVLVSSDEPDDVNGVGDGSTTGDVDGQDGHAQAVDVSASLVPGTAPGHYVATVMLRAEAQSQGDGRDYTITVRGADGAGNVAQAVAVVRAPN